MADERGDGRAANALGNMYESGQGVEKDDEKAFACYRRAADRGNLSGLNNLGIFYENGRGVEKNERAAVDCYRRSARQGNVEGMTNLGFCLSEGIGCRKDYKAAREWLSRAAKKESPRACALLADLLEQGQGGEKDERKAFRLMRKAAQGGYLYAQERLAVFYENGTGVKKNLREAFFWHETAAGQGNGEAMANLAWAYQFGLGVKKDLGQAARLYRQAIRAEESLPVYGYLGELLEAGAGGEPDPAEILDLYRTGAAKGDAVACLNLGRRCQRGDGVKKNEKKALDLYRKAGGAGYAALASCFRLGIGAERDMREAAAWYRKDAEEGGRTGMLWLALLYLRGDGVRKNRPRAEELCRRAADIQPGDREYIFYRMHPDREELRQVIKELEAETADEELRKKLKSMARRLAAGDKIQ